MWIRETKRELINVKIALLNVLNSFLLTEVNIPRVVLSKQICKKTNRLAFYAYERLQHGKLSSTVSVPILDFQDQCMHRANHI